MHILTHVQIKHLIKSNFTYTRLNIQYRHKNTLGVSNKTVIVIWLYWPVVLEVGSEDHQGIEKHIQRSVNFLFCYSDGNDMTNL